MSLQTHHYLQIIKINEVQQRMWQIMYKVNVCILFLTQEDSKSQLFNMLLYFQNQSPSLVFTNGSTVN